jgi:hypothetical protein
MPEEPKDEPTQQTDKGLAIPVPTRDEIEDALARVAKLLGPQSDLFDVDAAVVPGVESSAWVRMYHYFAYQRDTFLTHYHNRSNVETSFSMIKRKFGGTLRSKSFEGQVNEVLCKVICHNLVILISAIHEMGLEMPMFSNQIPA